MLSTILAYVTAAAMLTGLGSVPAVPETAIKTTVENIVISCGDESVALDHKLVRTEAVGSAEAVLSYDIVKGGESILPMQMKITPEEMLFSLVEGSAYSVSDEYVQGFLELEDEDVAMLTEAAEIIETLPEMFPAGSQMAYAEELYGLISAHEAAEVIETDDAMTEGVSLYLENGADYAFADVMRGSDTEYISRFTQWMMDMMNSMDDTEYTSYAEMNDGSAAYDSYTMYKSAVNGAATAYKLQVRSAGDDGEEITDMIFQPDYFSLTAQPAGTEEGVEEPLRYSCLMDDSGIIDAMFSIGYAGQIENIYGSQDEYTDISKEDLFVRYHYTRENGLGCHDFSLDILMGNSYLENGEEYYSDTQDLAFTCAAKERLDESGNVITGVEAEMDVDLSYSDVPSTELSLKAAFDVRSEEIPCADTFAGMDITPILNEDDIPPRLMGDVITLGSRASLLMYDDRLNAVIEMIENSVEANTPVDNRIEEKHKAQEENILRGAKNGEDIPDEKDDSAGMKYKKQEKEDFYKKKTDIYFN